MPSGESCVARKGDTFTAPEKRLIWLNAKGICQYPTCGKPVPSFKDAQFHHVILVWHGGPVHDVTNGVLLHAKCHTRFFEELHGREAYNIRLMKSKAARYHHKW